MLLRRVYHWLTMVLGLYLIAHIPLLGISFDQTRDLLLAALLFWFFNGIIKPILVIFTLPLVVLTLGLFLLVINAVLLDWISFFIPGYHVPGFWSAFFGAIVLSLITSVFSRWERRARRPAPVQEGTGSGKVIDI